mmetsp:Transcript_1533/g.2537  ORF Transcript_1533/g.2537 Transcript_1533/m.2537 type:complete len:388 (-) Transcript_1533:322-1485(-)|eukprot:CAMPEP_0184706274 /NCGR_PEP_ID=MMETSP0313-20130426/36674_1 /TAXON_ID=2792 /ORGANISM="Porphyridium aerugineum, Strain SAG 1380-2" /LENGTH=387 /DNA_ID=CAMNT_0027167823 /DNA_START=584 /DNA_END=1747 /DNA_ORIENTATION=+
MVTFGAYTDAGNRYGKNLNQDAFFATKVNDRFTIAGVCDGHGMLGDIASKIACEAFQDYFKKKILEREAGIQEEAKKIAAAHRTLSDAPLIEDIDDDKDKDKEKQREQQKIIRQKSLDNGIVRTKVYNGHSIFGSNNNRNGKQQDDEEETDDAFFKEIMVSSFEYVHEKIRETYENPPQRYKYGKQGEFVWDETRKEYAHSLDPDDTRPLEYGTTAVAVIYDSEKAKVYVCWVGDSHAILGGVKEGISSKLNHRMLTKPDSHKATNSAERARILSASSWPGCRVHLVHHGVKVGNYIFNISRALGHEHLSREPEFEKFKVGEYEQILVIGSDGLYDNVDDRMLIKLAVDFQDAPTAARELVTYSTSSSEDEDVDNTTAVVLFLDIDE